MNVSGFMLYICLILLLIMPGCSKQEEPPGPLKQPTVVKRIIRPPKVVKVAKRAVDREIPPRTVEEPGPEKASRPEVRSNPGERPGAGIKTAALENPSPKAPEVTEAEEKRPRGEAGKYVVKENDTLVRIAGREDVYGDPLKWAILCRHNMEQLGPLAKGEDFPERDLPDGMTLRIFSSEETEKNLRERPRNYWIANVLSSSAEERIVPAAIELLKQDYPVYITTVDVKGKTWMRLRVGFFKNKAEADLEGDKIRAVLGLSDLWISKIGDREFEGFAGY